MLQLLLSNRLINKIQNNLPILIISTIMRVLFIYFFQYYYYLLSKIINQNLDSKPVDIERDGILTEIKPYGDYRTRELVKNNKGILRRL